MYEFKAILSVDVEYNGAIFIVMDGNKQAGRSMKTALIVMVLALGSTACGTAPKNGDTGDDGTAQHLSGIHVSDPSTGYAWIFDPNGAVYTDQAATSRSSAVTNIVLSIYVGNNGTEKQCLSNSMFAASINTGSAVDDVDITAFEFPNGGDACFQPNEGGYIDMLWSSPVMAPGGMVTVVFSAANAGIFQGTR